jgi:glutamate---cysteine ligase / carboxylate-amine ligase
VDAPRPTALIQPLPTAAADQPTFGVEEEYLLLDPLTGAPVAAAEAVLARAGERNHGSQIELQPELVQPQLEIATPVCSSATAVRHHLSSARDQLAAVAREMGLVLAPLGAAPVGDANADVTPMPRYLAIRDGAPALVPEQLINGMHVHVQVANRRTGVAVMNRLRPWLHVLLALSANSPMWRGRDSGFASWRSIQAQRWPVEGAPPHLRDERDYERCVAALLATGVLVDRGQLYWQMRLSDRYPTVEVRVADVALDVDTAVTVAVLVRALVVTAARQAAEKAPEPRVPTELLRAASWQAARHGITGDLMDLCSAVRGGRVLRPAEEVLHGLVDAVRPALHDAGDLDQALRGVSAALATGGGAGRQRAALAAGGLPALLGLMQEPSVAA